MDQSPLHGVGMKATYPRLKILDIFQRYPDRHMSAADVYRQLLDEQVDIGLATVYRVLGQLAHAGLLARSQFDAQTSVFELAAKGRHDHLVCTGCGAVAESSDAGIADQARRIARRHGFALKSYSLSLYGRCARCRDAIKGVFE
ncbi:transcriptional repressor [Bordetella pseudohinzii]|uniref:Ferric uptake regulation protein n=1 Tax=Bordetella pseudohinzii TaxID=1331258 RepID=A0A0J6BXJ7_9BORD|nr:transcriptional repressor [Bordetella pseudohinzii]ANY17911.1 transcriptional repressor [Bordetella pseudohinzii]KMM26444.1 Fur family transcriptional regulator [Bordetella pseudohinzii]KXA79029.1 Fur family transcriptional regulator [Bordetella pseudohinzii]KXA80135.1 Fur family transcriptional regulator [Bordetella pseudohinzii]CUI79096.1 Ferric uptake regulation protein [Bordetella pseudohinzii]